MEEENKTGYLLDTNICISLLKNKYGIREKVVEVEPKNCYISEIQLRNYILERPKAITRLTDKRCRVHSDEIRCPANFPCVRIIRRYKDGA